MLSNVTEEEKRPESRGLLSGPLAWIELILHLMPFLLLLLIPFALMKKEGHKGRSNVQSSTTTFSGIAGMQTLKTKLGPLVSYLSHSPTFLKKSTRKVSSGFLFWGPTGTGKTLLALAVAGEAKCPYIQCSGPEFNSCLYGAVEENLRSVFDIACSTAKKSKTKSCLIIIDEIDSLLPNRDNLFREEKITQASRVKMDGVNQILALMDRLVPESGVVVIGTTNFNPHAYFDPAVIRAKRFGEKYRVEKLSSAPEKLEFLAFFSAQTKVSLSAEQISPEFLNWFDTPAQLWDIFNQEEWKEDVTWNQLQESIIRRKFTFTVLPLDRHQAICAREAAKIWVALSLQYTITFSSSRVVRKDGSIGNTKVKVLESKGTLQEKLDKICICMATRCSEKKQFYVGSASDLKKAESLIDELVKKEKWHRRVNIHSYDATFEEIWKEQYQRTSDLLDRAPKKWMDLLSENLLTREFLLQADIATFVKEVVTQT
jgi:ATP-dependent Zn protease